MEECNKLSLKRQDIEPSIPYKHSKDLSAGKCLPLWAKERNGNNKTMKSKKMNEDLLEEEKEVLKRPKKASSSSITFTLDLPNLNSPCHAQCSVFHDLISSKRDRKEQGIPRTTHMRLGGSNSIVTEGYTDPPIWLRLGGRLQRPFGMAPVSDSNQDINLCASPKSRNLILACKGVHMEEYKGAGGLGLYPSLRAEFGVNKIHGNSLDTFHTEPRPLRATEAECLKYQKARCYEPADEEAWKEEEADAGEDAGEGYGRGAAKDARKKEVNTEDEDVSGKDCRSFQLFVTTLSNRTLTLSVNKDDTILKIKDIINEREGIPTPLQRLIYSSKELNNMETLKVANIQKNSTLQLAMRIQGGSELTNSIQSNNSLQLSNGEICLYQPTQNNNNAMNIESTYGNMIQQVKNLGEFCRNTWAAVDTRINNVEGRQVTVEEAVTALVNKDTETTKIISDQLEFAESTIQALNWIKSNLEMNKTETQNNFQKISDWYSNLNKDSESLSKIDQDIRALNIAKQLNEDKWAQINNKLGSISDNLNLFKNQLSSHSSKCGDLDISLKKQQTQANTIDDRLQIVEKRLKDMQKAQEIFNRTENNIREHGQDLLILTETVEKLKKNLESLEAKTHKDNKKLTKNEKSILDELETSVFGIKERISSLETTVEHLNDVKFEDFSRRFKKEVYENSDNQVVKISKSLKLLEDQNDLQSKTSDSLQRSLNELRKKLDIEILKVQDLKYIQEAEEKRKRIDTQIDEINSNLEALMRKTKQHDTEILGLSDNVFDYSYKEMASSFDERVDNRLINVKQQIKDISTQISNLNKTNYEETTLNNFLTKIQKSVENKLEAHADMIDQKLNNLATNPSKLSVPLTTEGGKKILYKAGKSYADPKDIQASIDGTFKWKEKCYYGNKCDRVFCKRDHDEGICPKSSDCKDLKCKLRHLTEKSIKPPTISKRLFQDLEAEDQFQITPCKFKNQCPEVKCRFRHDAEACGGFKNCKKVNCKRRHHPSRIIPNIKPKNKPTQNEKKQRTTEKTPEHHQQPIYLSPTGTQHLPPIQYQQMLPFSLPWYGYNNMPQTFPASNQQPWLGDQFRRY